MRNKLLLNVVLASMVALFIAGCSSSPVSQSRASRPGTVPVASHDIITNTNDRSTWIDWPVGSRVY